MSITQTTSGIIVFDPLTDISAWGLFSSANDYGEITAASLTGPPMQIYGEGEFDNMGAPEVALCEVNAYKTLDLGSGSSRLVRLMFYGYQLDGWSCYPFNVGTIGSGGTAILPMQGTTGNAYQQLSATIPSDITGSQSCTLGELYADGTPDGQSYGGACNVYNLLICLGENLTVTGLTAGQVIDVYNASTGGLIGTITVASGDTQGSCSLSSVNFPLTAYMAIYASDGTTLLETTPTVTICGGDVWAWTPPLYGLKAASSAFIIVVS